MISNVRNTSTPTRRSARLKQASASKKLSSQSHSASSTSSVSSISSNSSDINNHIDSVKFVVSHSESLLHSNPNLYKQTIACLLDPLYENEEMSFSPSQEGPFDAALLRTDTDKLASEATAPAHVNKHPGSDQLDVRDDNADDVFESDVMSCNTDTDKLAFEATAPTHAIRHSGSDQFDVRNDVAEDVRPCISSVRTTSGSVPAPAHAIRHPGSHRRLNSQSDFGRDGTTDEVSVAIRTALLVHSNKTDTHCSDVPDGLRSDTIQFDEQGSLSDNVSVLASALNDCEIHVDRSCVPFYHNINSRCDVYTQHGTYIKSFI